MIWTYIKYFKNPFTLVMGVTAKFIFKNLLFKNLEWRDYNELLRLTVNLIPAENWYDLCKLLLRVSFTPYNEVTQIDQISGILQHTTFNSNLKKTNKKIEEERQDKSWKIFFISVILGGLWKKFYFFIRNFLLLPFKIGSWLFMGGIVGIDVSKILHWFDYLKFNVPYWFYNKLVDVHINWLRLFKNVGQIDSISTKDLEDIKLKNKYNSDSETINSENLTEAPKKYLGLEKTQWLIALGIGAALLLISVGIYIKFYSSDDISGGEGTSDLGSSDTTKLNQRYNLGKANVPLDQLDDTTPRQLQKALDNARSNVSWTDYIKNKIFKIFTGKTTTIIEEGIPSPFNNETINIQNNMTNLDNSSTLDSNTTSQKRWLGLSNKDTSVENRFTYIPKNEESNETLIRRPRRGSYLLARKPQVLSDIFESSEPSSTQSTPPYFIEEINETKASSPSLENNESPLLKNITPLRTPENNIQPLGSPESNTQPLGSPGSLNENITPKLSSKHLPENTDSLGSSNSSTGSKTPLVESHPLPESAEVLPKSRPLSPIPERDLNSPENRGLFDTSWT